MKTLARNLRKNPTKAEQRLWQKLRNRQLLGQKVRRQQIIGRYIVDFVYAQHKLIIELDGGQHAETNHSQKDAQRTAFLEAQGYRVLRFWNNEIMSNLDGVIEVIMMNLDGRLSPSPLAGEGRGEGAA